MAVETPGLYSAVMIHTKSKTFATAALAVASLCLAACQSATPNEADSSEGSSESAGAIEVAAELPEIRYYMIADT